jgi:hypothetical protein
MTAKDSDARHLLALSPLLPVLQSARHTHAQGRELTPMNRRKFVRSFGLSTLFSRLALAREPAFSWRKGDSPALWSGEASAFPHAGGPGVNPVWPRPVIVPLPTETAGVREHLVNLGGTWKFTVSPPADFWSNDADPAAWPDVLVPGELAAQGIPIARDVEYPYKRLLRIPAEAAGKRLLIRFAGVYSSARVWVNGKFVRDHQGGFTSWDCDITDCVTPGQAAWLTVGVTDRSDEISYASNYAKHYVGGILREVKLLILPRDYVSRFQVETDFDSSYTQAQLRATVAATFHDGQSAALKLRLKDPHGQAVPLNANAVQLTVQSPQASIEIPVRSPAKWDAEHPNLYTLEADVFVDGAWTQKLMRRVGFQKVERRRNRLYVNGDEVKLRGVCRHDVHPRRGRSTTPEMDEKDVILLRDANVNFVRTSHYPPTESFLEACDQYGIYVEEESAVCFVNQEWSLAAPAESAPEFTARYLNQFAEMVERDRSHPSVIIWSLGNESHWGMNFEKERAYVNQEDTTRPVIFSYPETVPKDTSGYDLYSEHYPQFDADLTSPDIPKLNDEYAHISCYNTDTLKRDPGVRNFWGHSLKRFWENCYNAPGCLGGAIWAGFDEVFLLPESPVGYGEWGIIDGWRRPKPEYWLTQKAYSPVRIADGEISNPGAGQALEIPAGNWFCHTNFSELKILWSAGNETGEIPRTDIAPGARGTLRIPARVWRDGDVLNLKFYRAGGILIDEFNLRLGAKKRVFPPPQRPAPKVVEDAESLIVQGADFHVVFSKRTGLVSEGVFRGRKILESGPFLNLGSLILPPWWPTSIRHSSVGDEAVISLAGGYMARLGSEGERVSVEFEIRIDGRGLITTDYTIHDQPKGSSEVGVAYLLPSSIDRLTWDRKALWSAYPSDHIGRPQGTATREAGVPSETYRNEPQGTWSQDSKDFFLYGPEDRGGRGTNDFRSLKENIWHASCVLAGTELRVRAESDGTAAVRAEVFPEGQVRFNINNLWGYPDLGWGNYTRPVALPRGYKNSARLRFTDTDES